MGPKYKKYILYDKNGKVIIITTDKKVYYYYKVKYGLNNKTN